MIPGSNLLSQAFTVIAQQVVLYYAFSGRTINSIGQNISTYLDPISVRGSFQPVSRNLYQQYGLDLQKSYYNFFVEKNVLDLGRNVSPDLVLFNGIVYQVESKVDWFPDDFWDCALLSASGLPIPT